MKVISELYSQKIKNMSFICSILVVFIHADWSSDETLLGWFMYHFVREGVARIAVPYFFVISGFFLSKHFFSENWWVTEIKKRIFSIYIPYLIWTIAFLVLTALPIIASNYYHNRDLVASVEWLGYDNLMGRILGFDLLEWPAYPVLWYLRSLFLFTICAYFFKVGVMSLKLIFLAAAFTLIMASAYIPSMYWREQFGRTYSIFYFAVGIYIGLYGNRSFVNLPRKPVFFAIIGGGILALKLIFDWYGADWRFCHTLCQLATPFVVYVVWAWMPYTKWPVYLTSSAFPMYVLHPIIKPYLQVIIPLRFANIAVMNFVMVAVTIIMCIGSAVFIRFMFPRSSIVLFGNR